MNSGPKILRIFFLHCWLATHTCYMQCMMYTLLYIHMYYVLHTHIFHIYMYTYIHICYKQCMHTNNVLHIHIHYVLYIHIYHTYVYVYKHTYYMQCTSPLWSYFSNMLQCAVVCCSVLQTQCIVKYCGVLKCVSEPLLSSFKYIAVWDWERRRGVMEKGRGDEASSPLYHLQDERDKYRFWKHKKKAYNKPPREYVAESCGVLQYVAFKECCGCGLGNCGFRLILRNNISLRERKVYYKTTTNRGKRWLW